MKYLLIMFAFLILWHTSLWAQDIRSYTVVVKTKRAGNEKGVLYNVTANAVVLDKGDSIVAIEATEIRSIKIFTSSAPYKYKKIFSYTPWDDNNFETRPNQQVRTRKWSQQDPSIKEEIAGYINTAAMNGVVNLIAAPIKGINGNIFKAAINQNLEKFNKVRRDLFYYSVYYQLHADYKEELKKASSVIGKDTNLTPSKKR